MPEIDFAALKAEDAALAPPVEPKTDALTEKPIAEPVAAPGTEPPATEDEPKPEKAPGIPVARFNSQTAKRREAERRADAAEARLAELERRGPAQATEPDKLSPSQFATYEEYTAAIAKQAASGVIEEARTEAQQRAQAEADERYRLSFKDRLAKEGKAIEGFKDVLEAVFGEDLRDDLNITLPMAQFLDNDAEHAAHLLKWLHDNPDEAERISELRPTAQVKELVRRDGLLGKSSKPVTRAPPPTPTVLGASVATQSFERMSHDDIKKWAKKQQTG